VILTVACCPDPNIFQVQRHHPNPRFSCVSQYRADALSAKHGKVPSHERIPWHPWLRQRVWAQRTKKKQLVSTNVCARGCTQQQTAATEKRAKTKRTGTNRDAKPPKTLWHVALEYFDNPLRKNPFQTVFRSLRLGG